MASAEVASDPPKCSVCGFHHPKFTEEDRHQKCGECNRTFPSKIGLEFHQRAHKK